MDDSIQHQTIIPRNNSQTEAEDATIVPDNINELVAHIPNTETTNQGATYNRPEISSEHPTECNNTIQIQPSNVSAPNVTPPSPNPDVLQYMMHQMAKMQQQFLSSQDDLQQQLFQSRQQLAMVRENNRLMGERILAIEEPMNEEPMDGQTPNKRPQNSPDTKGNHTYSSERPSEILGDYDQRRQQSTPKSDYRCNRPIEMNPRQLQFDIQEPSKAYANASAGPASTIRAGPASTIRAEPALHTYQRPIDLPEFHGRADEWPVFFAAYRQSSEAFNFSPLDNLFRLQKCLKGVAKSSVEYLLTDPENVEDIIADLEFRFGRPEILVQSQMAKLRQFKPLDDKSTDRLIEFASVVQNMVAYLNKDASRHVLGETAMMIELENKLPPSRQMQWGEYASTLAHRATAIDFCKWLKDRARCVTVLASTYSSPYQSTLPRGHNQVSGEQRNRPDRYSQQDRHVLSIDQSACEMCKDRHKTADCDKFRHLSVAERWTEAKRLGLCFGCLRNGHRTGDCRESKRCPVGSCTRTHNALLHREIHTGYEENRLADERPSEVYHNNPFRDTQGSVLNCRQYSERPLLFRILPVRLYGPKGWVESYALLDEGSSLTLIETDLADQLGATGPESNLSMQFVGQNSKIERSRDVTISISGVGHNAQKYVIDHVRTTKALNLPTQTVNTNELHSRYLHLRELPIQPYEKVTPRLLIGLEHADLGVPIDMRSSLCNSPIACKTKLGWVVYGNQKSQNLLNNGHVLHCIESTRKLDELDNLVKSYYTTENFGVKVPERIIESDDDKRARKILEDTTKRIGDRFQTGLLWRSEEVSLPSSYEMAQRRLGTIARKIIKDPEYGRLYKEQIDSYVAKGYTRKLSQNEAKVRSHRTWYLPHFGVQNPNKPGKLRIVFDGAAMVHGISLNSTLLKGPDLNEPMTQILFRFRMRQIAVCGDIAEMFHQVVVQPDDRHSQRFLWIGENEREPQEFEMQVMTFGATCSPTSAQFVKNKNADEFAEEFPAAVHAIKTSHYVDDYVASFSTNEEAIQVTSDIIEVHKRGGFQLRKLKTNSQAVLDALNNYVDGADMRSEVDMQLDALASTKILGMRWRTYEDVFCFDIQLPGNSDKHTPTKRELLSTVMSIYDPFGFLCDFMLPAKILIQDLWRTGITWDDPVPINIDQQWQKWRSEISATSKLRIPRCYSAHLLTSCDVQLHVFADASETAFSAVAYWRIRHGETFDVVFVAGKTRCAPLKPLSVPRLELQAAVLAVRLKQHIEMSHGIELSQSVLWSDSKTVLHWIRSDQRKYKQFVAHRVAEIIDGSGSKCWRWTPTKQNVADDATRVQPNFRFDHNSRWIQGPAFLQKSEYEWPIETKSAATTDEEQVQDNFIGLTTESSIIEYDRFSKFCRMKRTMAYALRFIQKGRKHGPLTAPEIHRATLVICRLVQLEAFSAEYQALTSGNSINSSSPLALLMPYIDDDGVMRMNGRTDLANNNHLPSEAQRPIILPKKHTVSKLIVRDLHNQLKHQLEDATICAVRQNYWIPHLRSLVRQVKNDCMDCRKRTATPIPQIEGQLPVDRLTPYVHPFTFTGLDYFGPINVSIGRRQEKRWIALFTCLTIRAIHMEVATDLSTDATIMCIRNFCNIRGIPNRIRSDRGTNFIGADGEMRQTNEFLDADAIANELSTKRIEWIFNCPANPEAGGAWERLVQSAKRILRITLKEKSPKLETLRSLVIEASNIINSRPLTHIPVTHEEPEPLTPNHFLLGRTNSTTVPVAEDKKQMCSRKQWRVLQQMTNQFWRRWINDYLPELTRRTRHHQVKNIEKNDLVLICDSNLSRNQWVRGLVESTIVGTDGRVRTAHIWTANGLVHRPVSKLAPLDFKDGELCPGSAHGGPGCRRASAE